MLRISWLQSVGVRLVSSKLRRRQPRRSACQYSSFSSIPAEILETR